MPRATLRFDLSDPDEANEFRIVAKAMDWALAMWDLDSHLRELCKYRYEDYGKDELAAFDAVRDKIRAILSERGISLEDII